MIRPYVESDGNSFYRAEEFDEAIDTLQAYCSLRGESIRGQLEGSIPSTSNGQRNASASLVNASGLEVSSMGSMGGNRGGFGSDESSGRSFGGSPGGSFSAGGFSGGFSGGERPSGSSSERPSSQRPSETTGQRTMPSSSDFSGFSMPQGFRGSSSNKSAWIQVGICALVLIAALGAVLLVRKHNE